MNLNPYQNKDMPLTTGVARALIRELFAGGDYVKRADIVERIVQHHAANGGKDTRPETVESAVKKVLSALEAEGLAERHPDSTGYWKIHTPSLSDASPDPTAALSPPFLHDGRERFAADLTALASQATEIAALANALASEAKEIAARLGKPSEAVLESRMHSARSTPKM